MQKEILSGLNLKNVKQKYKKQLDVDFKEDEIKDFDEENNKELYENLSNFNIMTADNVILHKFSFNPFIKNETDFKQEKNELLEGKLGLNEVKPLKGWGSWAGAGVKERKVDPQFELAQKKQKIVNKSIEIYAKRLLLGCSQEKKS